MGPWSGVETGGPLRVSNGIVGHQRLGDVRENQIRLRLRLWRSQSGRWSSCNKTLQGNRGFRRSRGSTLLSSAANVSVRNQKQEERTRTTSRANGKLRPSPRPCGLCGSSISLRGGDERKTKRGCPKGLWRGRSQLRVGRLFSTFMRIGREKCEQSVTGCEK